MGVYGQRGQGNFELAANFGYIHEGQLTLAKAYVSVGCPYTPTGSLTLTLEDAHLYE